MSDSDHRQEPAIEALLDEQRRFEPSPEFRAGAHAADEGIHRPVFEVDAGQVDVITLSLFD